MRIVRPGETLPEHELRFFAKMAGRSYLHDPVHTYATRDAKKRETFVYHFIMERLHSSNGTDYFYIDDAMRGICVWRKARNEYGVLDFLRCADWTYLARHLPSTVRTLRAYRALDVRVFSENTWIISPVFVAPEHQGKGVAAALIRQGIEDLTAQGYSLGLETQSTENVKIYEKLGFSVVKETPYPKGNITHYYMLYT